MRDHKRKLSSSPERRCLAGVSALFKVAFCVMVVACMTLFPAQGEEVTEALVKAKIQALQKVLIDGQLKNGSWPGGYSKGVTVMNLMALKQSGLPNDHEVIKKGLAYVLANFDFYGSVRPQGSYDRYYVPYFVIGFFELLGPEPYRPHIRKIVNQLKLLQYPDGGWSYFSDHSDQSSTQFVALALGAAERCGVAVPQSVKKKAKGYWHRVMIGGGGWGYNGGAQSFAMTSAGISSLIQLGEPYHIPTSTCGKYKRNPRIHSALKVLEDRIRQGGLQSLSSYDLYSLERVCLFLNLKEFAGRDWFREGTVELLKGNLLKVPYAETQFPGVAFSLLFLTKAYKPIAVTKVRWAGDWNNDHYDAVNWTKATEKALKVQLACQNDALKRSAMKDVLLSSMIFMNGHKEFGLTDDEVIQLRRYLDAGGIVVGEACCGSSTFKQTFMRTFKTRVYSGSQFKPLKNSHPIYSNVNDLTKDDIPIYVLSGGCAKREVFFLDKDISCTFNGDEGDKEWAAKARQLGINLMAYAVGKRTPRARFSKVEEPVEGLSAKNLLSQFETQTTHEALAFANPLGRVKHSGEWTTDPRFVAGLNSMLETQSTIPPFDKELVIDLEKGEAFTCSLLWMTGHGVPTLSDIAAVRLRRHLTLGGAMIVEACCSDMEFDIGFRRLVKKVFPKRELEEIPQADPVYHYPIELGNQTVSGTKAYAKRFNRAWPKLYGIRDGERWMMIYSPGDFSCAFDGDLEEGNACLKLSSAKVFATNLLARAFQVGPKEEKK